MFKRYPINQLLQERGQGKRALVLGIVFPLEHTAVSYFTDRPLSHTSTRGCVCAVELEMASRGLVLHWSYPEKQPEVPGLGPHSATMTLSV